VAAHQAFTTAMSSGLEVGNELVEHVGVVEPRLVAGQLVLADLAGHGLAAHCPGPGEVGPVQHGRVSLAPAAWLPTSVLRHTRLPGSAKPISPNDAAMRAWARRCRAPGPAIIFTSGYPCLVILKCIRFKITDGAIAEEVIVPRRLARYGPPSVEKALGRYLSSPSCAGASTSPGPSTGPARCATSPMRPMAR